MTKRQTTEILIENLVYKLNHVATQRKSLLDKLWELEHQTEIMRLDLIKLINERGDNRGKS